MNPPLDQFQQGYFTCALWSSTSSAGMPLDYAYDIEDIHPDTLAEQLADIADFREANAEDLAACELDDAKQGHDFWLTRNRHGAGFWDEHPIHTPEGRACERLTDASHVYGSVDLYVGDDGKIHA